MGRAIAACPFCGGRCNVADIGLGYRSVTCMTGTCPYGAAATPDAATAAHNRIAAAVELATALDAAERQGPVSQRVVAQLLARYRAALEVDRG